MALKHTADFQKAMSKMWLLRRMKVMKMEPDLIFDYYIKEIRPLTEQGVVVWNSGLTIVQKKQLESLCGHQTMIHTQIPA